MKKLLFIIIACIFMVIIPISCSESSPDEDVEIPCGIYNGNQLFKGPKGGCYYKNSNNNKTYVDRSYCSCL